MNSSDAAPPTDSLDLFHKGAFALLQPRAGGLKAGLDALLLASFVDGRATGRAIDVGAGTGAVGFAARSRAPALSLALLENDAIAAARLRRTLDLSANAGLASRMSVIEADLFAPPGKRTEAGLADGAFDLVLSNPPFYPHGHRASPDAPRRTAKSQTGHGQLERWLSISASLACDGGTLLFVLPPEALTAVLAAQPNRFGGVAIVPVHTKAGAPAKRMIVLARRGSKAPLRLLPGLILADANNTPTGEASAIAEGRFDGAALIG